MFKPFTLFYSDGYKIGHKFMLAPGTTRLYGTWIPRSLNHAPKGINKIISCGQQLTWRWLHDEFKENFFSKSLEEATHFAEDMSLYLGMEYDGAHFADLHRLGYLPMRVKSLPEGIRTKPGIPHMTFINTVDGFGWLTLYLETIVSASSWKMPTAATIAKLYRDQATEWVGKTCPEMNWLVDYMCHDFSARGLSPYDMLAAGLGHATSFRGSDTLIVIPGARYFYGEPHDQVCINSVNASEHSVSTTKIFTVGEQQMLEDWMKIFPNGILSVVADTFDLWKLITVYLPALKEQIMSREGKLVIRPDSAPKGQTPADIICGFSSNAGTKLAFGQHITTWNDYCKFYPEEVREFKSEAAFKGLVQLLWEIFGGTESSTGYKLLDSHIGAIYGDSITPALQLEIYYRLAQKGFATANMVLGVGSFTYQYNTRDTLGYAAKGAWFELQSNKVPGYGDCGDKCRNEDCLSDDCRHSYNIYKDPVTDSGTKKSLKGFCCVVKVKEEYEVITECTPEQESQGLLHTIYEDGKFLNQTTLTEIRQRLLQ
jgi:nicotinamide phosphoribosyltransferase